MNLQGSLMLKVTPRELTSGKDLRVAALSLYAKLEAVSAAA